MDQFIEVEGLKLAPIEPRGALAHVLERSRELAFVAFADELPGARRLALSLCASPI